MTALDVECFSSAELLHMPIRRTSGVLIFGIMVAQYSESWEAR